MTTQAQQNPKELYIFFVGYSPSKFGQQHIYAYHTKYKGGTIVLDLEKAEHLPINNDMLRANRIWYNRQTKQLTIEPREPLTEE